MKKFILLTIFSLVLSSCGGSGGNSEPSLKLGTTPLPILKPELVASFNEDLQGYNEACCYLFKAGILADVDDDGTNEFVFTFTSYPNQISLPIYVFGHKKDSFNLTNSIFKGNIPTVKHNEYIFYSDINNDGRKDLIFSEAGLDRHPWTGAQISVALNQGSYFSKLDLPETQNRNNPVVVMPVVDSKQNQILIADMNTTNYTGSGLVWSWKDNKLVPSPNPIQNWLSEKLYNTASMSNADFNNDGYQDLLLGSNGYSKTNSIIYGTSQGLTGNRNVTLPSGPFEEGGLQSFTTGSDVSWKSATILSVAIDTNKDAKTDIVNVGQEVFWDKDKKEGSYGKSWLSVLENIDGYKFTVKQQIDLGPWFYNNMIPFDVNKDGYMDIIGLRQSSPICTTNCNIFSTVFFINDKTGKFNVIEADLILPDLITKNEAQNSANLVIPLQYNTDHVLALQIISNWSRKAVTVNLFKIPLTTFTNLK